MKLTHICHACFTVATASTTLLLDPCDPTTGFTLKDIPADAVLCSHGHRDHSYAEAAAGNPAVLNSPGTYAVGDFSVTMIPCWHDEEQGAKRGRNLVSVLEAEGLRVVHLGDLGHLPDEELYAKIGTPDVLLIPVGGVFTIDAEKAKTVTDRINPKLVIPMHYADEKLDFRLGDAESYLKRMKNREQTVIPEGTLTVEKGACPENAVAVLNRIA